MFTVLLSGTSRRVALSEAQAQALYVSSEMVSAISHAGFFKSFHIVLVSD